MVSLTEDTTPGGIAPLARRSTAEIVAERLREAIMHGGLPPGSQLGEIDLANRLGVSRGPLREAMQRLVQEGLLRSEPHRGLFVSTLDEEEIRDVYTARLAVEGAACQLIMRGDRALAVSELTSAHQRMVAAAAADDRIAFSDADQLFHQRLVAVSGSQRLERMAQTLLVETRMCLTALQETYRPSGDTVEEHRLLVDAIEQGDERLLLERLEAHMTEAVERLTSAS
ncbi:GntR family transcriptional regulator [Actinoalloteichus sp. AHMU CJ021]|uniref:DNA-binding transcriptional regulator, GntR family n=1 Tax=Actinoalloteichus caeruleus DSM 43889 TaxID=1120930 RepID=A0ABT1JBU9_ACTCY|nr:GntR family transcriptional regulator [Actinoalloteichus caeruleus]AUS80597.1 GntR family transcriptional regulator [Actinoalloteichus sp. AHMU CJ021]MCP2329976.1 DNA-binding transcriptional regulator, GntR family [Actinoalloteichus caeruleus DSM 43889]